MSTWREERRRDKAAQAEQEREDRRLELEYRLRASKQAADQERRDREAERKRREEQKRRRQARRREFFAQLMRPEALIYAIAVASFVLAAPAMAQFGAEIYDHGSTDRWWLSIGVFLPIITEAGMWAFAITVHHRRTNDPDAPVAWLRLGVWVFAGVAFALNLVHGLESGWSDGVVMGVVSVAGVVAHQLVVADPPRSREERAAGRVARRRARKLARAQRAAIRQAEVEITSDGSATLVFDTGRFTLSRGSLTPTIDPLDRPGPRDVMDDEIAALIESETACADGLSAAEVDLSTGSTGGEDAPAGGGVATLDRPGDRTTPTPQWSSENARRGGRPRRSMVELRAALARLVQDGAVDPSSASSIRRALRCRAEVARRLRDEWQAQSERGE